MILPLFTWFPFPVLPVSPPFLSICHSSLTLSACAPSDSSCPRLFFSTAPFRLPVSLAPPSHPSVPLFPMSCALAVPTCLLCFSLSLYLFMSLPSPTTLSLCTSLPRQSLLIPGKSASRFGRRGSALGIGAVEEVVIHPGAAAPELPARAVLRSLALRTEAILGTLPPSRDKPKGVQGRVPRLW